MHSAGVRVLNRLRGQLPERLETFRFFPLATEEAEALRPHDRLYLQALYLNRGEGVACIEVFGKAQELTRNELDLARFLPSLYRMEARGLVSVEIRRVEGHYRSFYKINELGERVLREPAPPEPEAIEDLGHFA